MISHLLSSPPEFMRKIESIISLSILLAALADDPPPEAPCWGFDPPEVWLLCPATFTAQSRRKQEQQDEGSGRQDAFGNIDANDQRLRWYTVSELNEFICELCKNEMQRNKSKVLGSNTTFNPEKCVNCCANWNADTNGVARSTDGRKIHTRLFAECRVAFPGHLMVNVNNVQAMTAITRELVYSKLKKELSHVGFVSMTVDQAAQFYNHKHGRQLCAARDVVTCKNSEQVEERTSVYVIDRDNVAYSSWIKSVLDQGTMYELLGQTTNEESLGDVVKMILGFFEVMSYFQHELPLWRDAWKIKTEFERSIVRGSGTSRPRNSERPQKRMNPIKPRHPLSLVTEQANQGSKTKVLVHHQTGAEAPSPIKRQRRIDGRRAALKFLDSMEKRVGEMGVCAKCANLAHDGDCKKREEAAGNEKAMKKIRELLSSDHVSSDEEMGDAEGPSSSTSKEKERRGTK